GSTDLGRSQSGLDVTADTPPDVRPYAILVETCDVQTEAVGVLSEINVFERVLPMKEQVVHRPEGVLQGGCFGSSGRSESVRMDLDEREVPEGETNAPAQFLLDAFDRAKRPTGVRALVVAVLENQPSRRRPAGVVDLLVQRHQTPFQLSRPPRRNRREDEAVWSRSHPPMASSPCLSRVGNVGSPAR